MYLCSEPSFLYWHQESIFVVQQEMEMPQEMLTKSELDHA